MTTPTLPDKNTLYYGDCLDVMQSLPDASVDLIYLDPPFNSNANTNISHNFERLFKSAAQCFILCKPTKNPTPLKRHSFILLVSVCCMMCFVFSGVTMSTD